MHLNRLLTICLALSASLAGQQGADQRTNIIHGKDGITLPPPPLVKSSPVTDEYKSENSAAPVKVTDNYRWLENATAPETRAFIKAQNAYTQRYLEQVKILPEVRNQMAALMRVDFFGIPERRGNRYFFAKRLAAENQASIYMRTGLYGPDERLVDANALSADQNTSLAMVDLAEDGSLLAYGVRVGGADELEIHFLNPATRLQTADMLPAARYYGVQISPDRKGVYYSKFFPHEGTRVFYHAFGTRVTADIVLFGGEYRGEKLGEIDNIGIEVTANGHYLVFSVGHGVPAKREDILVKDLRVADSSISPLVYGVESRFSVEIIRRLCFSLETATRVSIQ